MLASILCAASLAAAHKKDNNDFAQRVFATQTLRITRPYEAAVTGFSNNTGIVGNSTVANSTSSSDISSSSTSAATSSDHKKNAASVNSPKLAAAVLGAAALFF